MMSSSRTGGRTGSRRATTAAFDARPRRRRPREALRPLLTSTTCGQRRHVGRGGHRRRRPRRGRAPARRPCPASTSTCSTSIPRCTGCTTTSSRTRCCGSCTTGCSTSPRRPRFDDHFREAWDGVRRGERRRSPTRVADAAAEGDSVLVQDYQLALVPGMVRAARPDLRVVHFTHTPFCGPNSIRVLPTDVAEALCASMASVPCGFHTARWARGVRRRRCARCSAAAPTSRRRSPRRSGPTPTRWPRSRPAGDRRRRPPSSTSVVGDRKLMLRSRPHRPVEEHRARLRARTTALLEHAPGVARARGVRGHAQPVAREPGRVPRVPQRGRAGRRAGQRALGHRPTGSRSSSTPATTSSGPSPAFTRYDVLLVNPIKDGLNLVAKEGPLVNGATACCASHPRPAPATSSGSASATSRWSKPSVATRFCKGIRSTARMRRSPTTGERSSVGSPDPLTVGRYHSLIAVPNLPAGVELSASCEGTSSWRSVIGELPAEGVQFHPESVLTPEGKRLLANFMDDGPAAGCDRRRQRFSRRRPPPPRRTQGRGASALPERRRAGP